MCAVGGRWNMTRITAISSFDADVDLDGKVWIASEQGLLSYQFGKIARHPAIGVPVLELCLEGDLLWCSTKDGRIFRLSVPTGTLRVFDDLQRKWSVDWIEEMILDGQNRLWVNPYGDGMHVLDADSMKLINSYRFQSGNRFGLRTNLLESIFIDRSGTLWAGTANTGVEYYVPFANKQFFNLLRNDPEQGFDLRVNGVHGVFVEPDNTLWLGTDGGGMFVLEPDDNSANNYRKAQHYSAEQKNGISLRLFLHRGAGKRFHLLDSGLGRVKPVESEIR